MQEDWEPRGSLPEAQAVQTAFGRLAFSLTPLSFLCSSEDRLASASSALDKDGGAHLLDALA